MRAVVMLCTSCRRHRLFCVCVSMLRFGFFSAEKGQKGNLFTLRNLNNERSIRVLATKEFQLNLVFLDVSLPLFVTTQQKRGKNAGAVAKQRGRYVFS